MRACATAAAAALAAMLATPPAMAVAGGDIAVLTKGHYICELPGDPSDPDLFGGKRQPESDFDVIGDSSYRAQGVRGIYLLIGETVRFTTGPLEGKRLHRVNATFLRTVNADGTDGDLRCVSSIQATARSPSDTSRCKRQAIDKVALRRPGDLPAC